MRLRIEEIAISTKKRNVDVRQKFQIREEQIFLTEPIESNRIGGEKRRWIFGSLMENTWTMRVDRTNGQTRSVLGEERAGAEQVRALCKRDGCAGCSHIA